jgi:PAS domain S-box-containing protein
MKKVEKKTIKPEFKGKVKTKKPMALKNKDIKDNLLRVLILEDNPADAELMEHQLKKSSFIFVSRRVESKSEFLKALKAFSPDLILADYTLPRFNALQALELVRKKSPAMPFIVVTGNIGDEKAVACLRAGANDYLLKDRLARLGDAVKQAMEKHRLQAEKNAAEEALRTSEQRLRRFYESGMLGVIYWKMNGQIIDANDKFLEMTGYTRDDLERGKIDWIHMTPPEFQHLDKNSVKELKATGVNMIPFEKEYIRKDGTRIPVLLAGAMLDEERFNGVAFVLDISKSKRAQEQIEQAARKWTISFDSIRDSIVLLSVDQTILQANRAFANLVNKPFRAIIGEKCYALMHSNHQPDPHCPFAKMRKSKKREAMELSIADRIFEVIVDPITDAAGMLSGATQIMTDITERKQAEAMIRESEDLYRDLVENSQVLICTHDLKGNLLSMNNAATQSTGYPLEDLLRMNLADLLAPEVRHLLNAYLTEIRTSGRAHGTMRIRTAGGETRTWEFDNTLRTDGVKVPIVRGIAMDITERRKAESQRETALAALREMNEIFRLFLKHNPIYVFIKDENIRPVYLSENYEKLLGRPLPELLGKNMDELFPSELSRTMIEDDKKMLREGKSREFIEEMNGRTYSTLKFPILINGVAKYLAGYTTDITERRLTEEALLENQARLKAFMDFVPSLILIKDHGLRPIFANEAMRQNFPIDQWLGKKPHELFPAEVADLMVSKDSEALEKGFTIYEEAWTDRFDQQRFFLTQKFRIERPHKEPLLGAIISDITERKQAENRLKASLLEKEVLLKEIHHRVKNNLQVISGLLTLQGEQIKDERLQRLIKESQGRIWTMALIHQTLYQSGNLADIDMADYIRALSGNLLSSHAQVAMPPTVSFDLLPVRLVIDKAIPLALIINELLTNAMKHAFPDGRPGEIRISLQERTGTARVSPNGGRAPTDHGCAPAYELTVADNGAGLPAGFDLKNQKSLGLQLVAMLAKQLGGQLAIESNGGTSAHIKFSNNEKN